MYCTDHALFLLVNHRGVAALTCGSDNTFVFSYFYDANLFDNRTSTIFHPYNHSLICHVYEDDFLRTEAQMNSHPDAVTFIKYTFDGTSLGEAQAIIPLCQQLHPEWQAVVVNPLDEQTVAIEWKHTGKDQVKFEYSSFNFDNGEQEIKTRTWFLATFKFSPALGNHTDKRYVLLFKACIADLAVHNEDFLVHFNVKSSRNNQIERFSFSTKNYEQSPDSGYFSIPVIKRENLLCALLPDEKVLLLAEETGRVREIALPPLPAHFRYTAIILFQELICTSWEDIRFTHVGAAGLAVTELPHK
ncbi:MAG: hypothetical protein JW822_12725 [Spirochaetales bacterium]|nr:hypothetical protein [Spirochaetales bacterium]